MQIKLAEVNNRVTFTSLITTNTNTMTKFLKAHIRNLNSDTIARYYRVTETELTFIVKGTKSLLYFEFNKSTGEILESNFEQKELTDKIFEIILELLTVKS